MPVVETAAIATERDIRKGYGVVRRQGRKLWKSCEWAGFSLLEIVLDAWSRRIAGLLDGEQMRSKVVVAR